MGLIDKAWEMADAQAAKQAADSAKQAEQMRQQRLAALQAKYPGVEIALDRAMTIASSKRVYGDRMFGRSEVSFRPIDVQVQTFLADGEVRLTHHYVEGSGSASDSTHLVRRCEHCHERYTETKLDNPYGHDERDGATRLAAALMKPLTTPAECSYCWAVREQSTCPTCHRLF